LGASLELLAWFFGRVESQGWRDSKPVGAAGNNGEKHMIWIGIGLVVGFVAGAYAWPIWKAKYWPGVKAAILT